MFAIVFGFVKMYLDNLKFCVVYYLSVFEIRKK